MRKFLLLHYGFVKPTPDIMAAWKGWFDEVATITVDQGGLMPGAEITSAGVRALPMDMECITGYTVIEAEDFAAAEAIAQRNPFVSGIRVYEIRPM